VQAPGREREREPERVLAQVPARKQVPVQEQAQGRAQALVPARKQVPVRVQEA
jgi:hypothetical protein